jgi:DNA modification methylase
MTFELITGDCLAELAKLPDESAQCCVTSPPYWGLRDYGVEGQIGLEETPEAYVARLVAVFREVRRVLRDDGVMFLNLGDSMWGGKGKSGYELPHEAEERRAKGETFQTGHNVPGYMGMRPSDGKHPVLKPKDLVGIPWRVAFALQADGWWLRSDIIWAKPNPMPESVTDRPTKAHEYVFLLSKAATYYYDAEAIREIGSNNSHGGGNPETHLSRKVTIANGGNSHSGLVVTQPAGANGRNARSVWTIATQPFRGAHFATMPVALAERCIKAGSSERGCCGVCGAPWERVVEKGKVVCVGGSSKPERDKREMSESGPMERRKADGSNASQYATQFQQREHLSLGWRPTCACGGDVVPCVVSDPFSGAGTTGVAAIGLGRSYIGIELKAEYNAMAQARLDQAQPPLAMMAGVTQ